MKHIFTLDKPVTCRIKVQGHIDTGWGETFGMAISVVSDTSPITSLTGKIDQAALHGVLRQIYSIGLPLISVQRIEPPSPE